MVSHITANGGDRECQRALCRPEIIQQMLLGVSVLLGALVQLSNADETTDIRTQTTSPGVDPIELKSWGELRSAIYEHPRWIKVHAAEFLLELGDAAEVERLFLIEEEEHGEQSQYRIGIWRVLAQTVGERDRQKYIDRIIAAAIDEDGADRVHAIESLSKLGVALKPADRERLRSWTETASVADSVYGHWWFARTSETEAERTQHMRSLTSFLTNEDAQVRHRAAYTILRLNVTNEELVARILAAGRAATERSQLTDADRLADVQVMIAAWTLAGTSTSDAASMRKGAEQNSKGDVASKRAFADALAVLGEEHCIPIIAKLLRDEDADVRCSAAHAVLKIRQKKQ